MRKVARQLKPSIEQPRHDLLLAFVLLSLPAMSADAWAQRCGVIAITVACRRPACRSSSWSRSRSVGTVPTSSRRRTARLYAEAALLHRPLERQTQPTDALIPPAVIKSLANHVLTDKGIEGFMADWAKTGQKIG